MLHLLQEPRLALRAAAVKCAPQLLDLQLLWRGTVATETFRLALAREGIAAEAETLGLRAPKCAVSQLLQACERLRRAPPRPRALADLVENIRRQKYDNLISEDILREAYARTRIDTPSIAGILDGIV